MTPVRQRQLSYGEQKELERLAALEAVRTAKYGDRSNYANRPNAPVIRPPKQSYDVAGDMIRQIRMEDY